MRMSEETVRFKVLCLSFAQSGLEIGVDLILSYLIASRRHILGYIHKITFFWFTVGRESINVYDLTYVIYVR